LSLQGVASPSLLNHGRVGLVHIRRHARASAKPCESRVYDGGRACDLLHARGSHIPYSDGGYVVACVVFYKRRFGVPSHQFLRSLLQFYSLELHHLTPLGILHKVDFVTLCKAYVGIEPHYIQWNSFFRSWL
jgi:hypothetical protein